MLFTVIFKELFLTAGIMQPSEVSQLHIWATRVTTYKTLT